jgi:hypothetical protein
MTVAKPKDVDAYRRWLKDKHSIDISPRHQTYYSSVTSKVKNDLESSDFWNNFTDKISEINDEYLINTKYHLLSPQKPIIYQTFQFVSSENF